MVTRFATCAAALGVLFVGPAIGGDAERWRGVWEVSPLSVNASKLPDGIESLGVAKLPRSLSVEVDAALYDQGATETLTGSSNFGTLGWQFSGSLRLFRRHGWGTGALGWTFLGSRSNSGAGSPQQTLSAEVGSISGLNANVVPNAAAIDEVFWRHSSVQQRWTLLIGRVDQSAYFDANRVANDGYRQFLAFAFENNLSVPWPTYGGFGGVFRRELGSGSYLLASVAAIGDDPRVPWSNTGHEGWNGMLEIGASHMVPGLGRGHVRVTPWHSSIPGAQGFGVGVNVDQELGTWHRTAAADTSGPSRGRLIGFFRAGVGEPAVTPVQGFVSGGFAVHGPFGRPRDRVGVGIAWSNPSPGAGTRRETLVEAYYRFALSPALSLTPDVQVVVDPALDNTAGSSIVLGVRLHLHL